MEQKCEQTAEQKHKQALEGMLNAFVGGPMLGFIFGKSWLNTPKGRRKFDHWLITAPILGPVFLMVAVSRFTKTLSTLLSSGVPIIPALDITKSVVNNTILTEVREQAKVEVQEGNSLASTINKSGVFPGLVPHMIATGEKTGEMVTMLSHVAQDLQVGHSDRADHDDVPDGDRRQRDRRYDHAYDGHYEADQVAVGLGRQKC